MIIINITIFLLPYLMIVNKEDLVAYGAIYGPSIVIYGELWRLITAMFLHGGVEHIFMNMLSLWFVGRVVEMWFDKFSYITIYFISGLIGGLISIYAHPVGVAVGASGAIFGIFGGMAGIVIVNRRGMEAQFRAFIKEFGIILLLNLIIGVVFESVDLSAHIGGLIAGLIGGVMIAKGYGKTYILLSTIVMVLIYNYILPELYITNYEFY